LSKVKATALRDIPGLLVLDINNTPPVAAAAPEPLLDDPGKRVSSIVPGDVAYVVTADGSRYFEGALLPTGQRITAIEEGLVVLERNGTSTTVRF
jgi:type III secretion protein D